jgi:hypothetical protein
MITLAEETTKPTAHVIPVDLKGETIGNKLMLLIGKVKDLVVGSPEQEADAIEMGKKLKDALADLEAREDELSGAAKAWVKQVSAWAKPAKDATKAALDDRRGTVTRYRQQVMEEQRKIEEKARKEREAAERKAEKKAEKTGDAVVFIPPPAPAPLAKTTETESGTKGTYRMVKKWRIKDASKIPRSFYVIDEVAINKQVRAGVLAIDGIEIYEEPELSIR